MSEQPITVTRAIKHKVNMGNYEGIETFASVSMEVSSDADPQSYGKYLDGLLADLVEKDLDEAAKSTAEKKTYIQYWKVEN
jgi:hypothetical protein